MSSLLFIHHRCDNMVTSTRNNGIYVLCSINQMRRKYKSEKRKMWSKNANDDKKREWERKMSALCVHVFVCIVYNVFLSCNCVKIVRNSANRTVFFVVSHSLNRCIGLTYTWRHILETAGKLFFLRSFFLLKFVVYFFFA